LDSGSGVNTFDLDGNGVIDNADTLSLLSLIGALPGDANLDGTVNAADLNRVGIHWLSTNCASWENGDFSGDGRIDATDLNILGLRWLQSVAQQVPTARPPRAALGQRAPIAPEVLATEFARLDTFVVKSSAGEVDGGEAIRGQDGRIGGLPPRRTSRSSRDTEIRRLVRVSQREWTDLGVVSEREAKHVDTVFADLQDPIIELD
jgi:hypothetical protein